MSSIDDIADRIERRLDEALSLTRPASEWLTVQAAAEYSSLSPETIRKLGSQGRITLRRPVRGRVLISRRELDDYIRGAVSTPRTGRGRS